MLSIDCATALDLQRQQQTATKLTWLQNQPHIEAPLDFSPHEPPHALSASFSAAAGFSLAAAGGWANECEGEVTTLEIEPTPDAAAGPTLLDALFDGPVLAACRSLRRKLSDRAEATRAVAAEAAAREGAAELDRADAAATAALALDCIGAGERQLLRARQRLAWAVAVGGTAAGPPELARLHLRCAACPAVVL